MSLDWQFDNFEESKKLDPAIRSALIWACMPLGMPGMKNEAELDEWIWRLCVLKQTNIPIMENSDGSYWPSRNELALAIGLRTNAGHITRKQFLKRITSHIERECDTMAKRWPDNNPSITEET